MSLRALLSGRRFSASHHVLGATLATAAFVASPGHASARATEPLAGIEAPVEAAIASETPEPATTSSCDDVLKTATTNEHLDEHDSNMLHGAVSRAVASDAGCASRVRTWLATHACTQVHGVVSSAAFGVASWPAEWTAAEVDRATKLAAAGDLSCAKRTLPSVQQVARVDARLADAVVKATALSSDRETADAAWMVLGTVELQARLTGETSLAKSVDGRIAAELHRRTSSGADATALLEAAGNGGCQGCNADVERAMASKDARVRRIAAGALRFSEHQGSVARACSVLKGDAEESVRAHVAWSLGWSQIDLDARVACLRDAATNDKSKGVRADAARALENLGASETDASTGE